MDRDAWKRYDSSGSWFYEIHDTGFKYNLSDVHAAIGVAQLRRADELMRRRQTIAQRLQRGVCATDPALQMPVRRAGRRARVASLCDAVASRAAHDQPQRFVELLRERGVGTSVHCIPLNTMAFYQQRYGYRTGDFPVAEDVYSRCLSLPIFPAMSDEDVAYVIETVLALARENRR